MTGCIKIGPDRRLSRPIAIVNSAADLLTFLHQQTHKGLPQNSRHFRGGVNLFVWNAFNGDTAKV
ncbi:hypothetical protein QUB33_27225 [Microcoleus sp. B3-A4]|uniref:hypothetical protein n=1 Tax=Microcoleus sp. B3-A4 TaxID=2818653 RepID=UPI002FD0FFFE